MHFFSAPNCLFALRLKRLMVFWVLPAMGDAVLSVAALANPLESVGFQKNKKGGSVKNIKIPLKVILLLDRILKISWKSNHVYI